MTFEEWATREGLDMRKGTESNPNDYRDRATYFAHLAYQRALEEAAQFVEACAGFSPQLVAETIRKEKKR